MSTSKPVHKSKYQPLKVGDRVTVYRITKGMLFWDSKMVETLGHTFTIRKCYSAYDRNMVKRRYFKLSNNRKTWVFFPLSSLKRA